MYEYVHKNQETLCKSKALGLDGGIAHGCFQSLNLFLPCFSNVIALEKIVLWVMWPCDSETVFLADVQQSHPQQTPTLRAHVALLWLPVAVTCLCVCPPSVISNSRAQFSAP
jgi:hypothetical protein